MTHLLMLLLLIGAIKWMFACRSPGRPSLQPGPGGGGALRDEMAHLKNRIATLERIAVDECSSSAALAADIESLRD